MRLPRRTPAALLLVILACALLAPARPAAADTPRLQITKAGPSAPVESGDLVTFTLNYRCASLTTDCRDVQIRDTIAPEFSGLPADVLPGTSDDVASVAYDQPTRTVTWTLNDPLPAGTVGSVVLRLRFPPGTTPDGTVATNRAEIRAANAPPVLSAPVTVTARARSRAYAEKTLLSGGVPDLDTVYRVAVCQPAGSNVGGLNLTNVTMRDSLPAGAQFVSASHGGVYDSASHSVTWPPISSVNVSGSASCTAYTLTLRYPDAAFDIGQVVRNDLVVTGTPVGEALVTLTDYDIYTLQPPTPGLGFAKEAPAEARVGETVRYHLRLQNTGTTALANVTVTDPIPPELEVSRIYIGTNNRPAGTIPVSVEYQTNLTGWRSVPGSPFATPGSQSVDVAALGLLPGERITTLRWGFGTLPYGFDARANPATGFDARVLATPINTIVVNTAGASFSYNGVTTTRSSATSTRVIPPAARPSAIKSATPTIVGTNDPIVYTLRVQNNQVAPGIDAPLGDPVLADLLETYLEYVPGSQVLVAAPAGAPAPRFELIPDYNASGRTLLRWSWNGASAYDLPSGQELVVQFTATVKRGTPAGPITNTAAIAGWDPAGGDVVLSNCQSQPVDTNDLDGDGNTSEQLCTSSITTVVRDSLVTMASEKWVIGQLDADWTRFPDVGQTRAGGQADYRMRITNTGTIPVTQLVAVDILPFVSGGGVVETGVIDLSARGSEWRPYLIGPVEAPAGVTVFYSTEKNPCRSDFVDILTGGPVESPPGCTGPLWSTIPPADITTVQAFKLDFGTLVLYPGDTVELRWPMRAPLGGIAGQVAWNSFAFQARRADTGDYLLASEPVKVGIARQEPVPASYGDYAWIDTNGNGEQDPAETGINGVRVDLFTAGPDGVRATADDVFVGYTATGPDDNGQPGFYLFSDLLAGDYYIRTTPPPGYRYTTPGQGGDPLRDADIEPLTGMSPLTTLALGEDDHSWDIGLVPPVDGGIGRYVWFDRNGDGLQNEPVSDGLNGVTVRLYSGAGPLLATTVTSDDAFGRPGFYLFGDLPAGTYRLEFVLPAGMAVTTRGATAGSDPLDSDPDAAGSTELVALPAGVYDLRWDAGLQLPVGTLSLGDRVFRDNDNDGLFEPLAGEIGIDGVRLNLYRDLNGNGAIDPGEYFGATTSRTERGEAGTYRFDSLPAGDYMVQIDPGDFGYGGVLRGSSSSTGNDPAPDPDTNRNHDDDGPPAGPQGVLSAPITLTAGAEPANDGDTSTSTNLTLDFGFFSGSALGDRVWFDGDADGTQDAFEAGIPGVAVDLLDAGGTLLATTVTDGYGRYGFSDLQAGSYRVRVTIPTGYSVTTRDAGSDAADSDIDPLTGETTLISLPAVTADTTWDAGLVAPPASIGDRVWYDDNRDGIQDPTELSGPDGVTVRLYNALRQVVATTTTAGGGYYSFSNLVPGSYSLEFDALPAGYAVSPQNVGGDDAQDSDADRTTRRTAWAVLVPGQNDPSWDLGIYTFATIGDRVWNDPNADGIQDAGETSGVGGVRVRLFRPNAPSPVAETTTDSSGWYQFTNLVPGDYYLEFGPPPSGYAISPQGPAGNDPADSDADVATRQTEVTTLIPGENDTSWDMGLYRTAALGDRVWYDLNANGVQDSGEGGVPGVQVLLLDGAGTQLDATVTDADGAYRFGGLRPGDYAVEFLPPPTYLVSPRDRGGDDTADSDAAAGAPHRTAVTTLVAGEYEPQWDAGLYQLASLGDRVWHDLNADGVQDPGEPSIDGVDVTLVGAGPDGVFSTGDDTSAATTTAGGGLYQFGGLTPGSYYVQFTRPAAYSDASPADAAAATDETDSDADPLTLRTAPTFLVSGANDLSWDMGLFRRATLGDRVWDDADANGVQDGGEAGIDGVTVTLYRADGSSVASTVTAGGGLYSFSGLLPGDYYVRFTSLPAGYTITARDQGDDAFDSDALKLVEYTDPFDPATRVTVGQTALVALRSGDAVETLDAGLFRMVTIGDRAWEDTSGDGIQDAGETTGVAGVRVDLYTGAGVMVDTTYTDVDGLYRFSELLPGDYYVAFSELPAGWVVSPQDRGGDDAADSDTPATAPFRTATFTRVPGDEDLTRDIGLYRTAALGNFVWHDLDADGVQETGEPGIASVSVRLAGAGLDHIFGTADDTTATTSTDAGGSYSFGSLTPGRYYLEFTRPAGYSDASPRDAATGTDDTDSDADPATLRTADITLVSGQTDLRWDQGFFNRAGIGNRVWEDTDGDGVQDASETGGIDGVTVEVLRPGPDGAPGTADDQLVATTSTAGGGVYSFTNLIPGNYFVRITPPATHRITLQDRGGNDASDSDADRTSGLMAVTLLTSGENDQTWDAGLYRPARLGDFVWEDLNGDGIQQAGEPGINNRTVTLRWAGPDATIVSGDDVLTTTTTDVNGWYQFTELIPGVYRVEFGAAPANYAYTQRDVATGGGNDTNDSDPNPSNGWTNNFSLVSGADDQRWDAGFYQLLTLGSRVWNDANNNGVFDAGDGAPPAIITMSLYRDHNRDGDVNDSGETTPVQSVATNAAGYYLFTGLEQGDYLVQFTPPGGWVTSTGTNGSSTGTYEPAPDADANASDQDDNGSRSGSNIRSRLITLAPGSEPTGAAESDPLPATITNPSRNENSNLTLDFGIFRRARVGNFVWFDRDADGLQDGGDETGVAGVGMTLRQAGTDGLAGTADDVTVATLNTNGSGNYTFDNLIPGSYYVQFSLPGGYRLSPRDIGSDASDSDADTDLRTVVFTLAAGDSDTSRDMGLYRAVRLGNLVWQDTNNNGVRDAGENGIENVQVNLYRDVNANGLLDAGDGAAIASDSTDAAGAYGFIDLTPGAYLVQIDPANFTGTGALAAQPGLVAYVSSSGTNGSAGGPYEPAADPDDDQDNNDNGSAQTGVVAQAVTLRSGDEPAAGSDGDDNDGNLTVDFGFYRPASLGDRVWLDADGDGVQDGGEGGISGVTVRLYAGATLVATTATDASGWYAFDYLAPRNDYAVEIVPLANHAVSPPNSGANTEDSDIDPATLRTAAITLTAGQEDPTWDAGLYELLSLGSRVWDDRNNTGSWDTGEPGLDGITVTLYRDADGNDAIDPGETTPVASTTTTDGGYYLFTGLLQGNYRVELSGLPAGYRSSTGTNGSDSGPYEPPADPDNDIDRDDNGVQAGATLIRSGFIRLAAGAEPLDESEPLPGTFVNPSGNASTNLALDFGLFRPARVGDRVWFDQDADGMQDAAETSGVASVPVELRQPGTDGQAGTADDVPVASTTTDSTGTYTFDTLAPGDYYVQFSLPGGYRLSPRDIGSDASDSDADTDLRTVVFTLAAGDSDTSRDMGLYRAVRLGNLVWQDTNNNGVRDAGENGIENVRVNLYRDVNANGVLDTGDGAAIATTTTGSNGEYVFNTFDPGAYLVQLDPASFAGGVLAGYASSSGTNGSAGGPYEPAADPDDDQDNDDNGGAQPGQGLVALAVSLRAGDEPASGVDGDDSDGNLTVDFGVYRPASLGDRVWLDANGDGVQDGGEDGISGLTVRLYTGAALVATTATGIDGRYRFDYLAPRSDYRVEVVPPAHRAFSPTGAGTPISDSDIDPASGQSPAITLAPGQEDLTWDAGLYPLLSLGNRVWDDLDNNGRLDPGEPGLDAVPVRLYHDANGNGTLDGAETTPVASTTTAGGGAYLFSDLPQGRYLIEVTPPAGYRSSTGVASSFEPGADPTGQVDSDDNGTNGTGVVATGFITLAAGDAPWGETDLTRPPATVDSAADADADYTLDIGLYRRAALGDRVWLDANGNGVQDGGESGVENVTVELYAGSVLVADTTTDASGIYGFADLEPGSYTLRFVLPAGQAFSPAGAGTPASDSDADPATGRTTTITLVSGQNDLDRDAGIYALLSLGDTVWHDLDGDGAQDPGEPGIDGVTVELYRDANSNNIFDPGDAFVTGTTTTGGGYRFDGLVQGDYLVVLPAANVLAGGALEGFTSSGDGTLAPDPDDDADRDDNGTPDGGQIAARTVTLRAGDEPPGDGDLDTSTNLAVDFGFYTLSLGNRVWEDQDNNGRFDPGEPGLDGVPVRLYRDADGNGMLDGAETTPVASTTTAGGGAYLFSGLAAGSYLVEVLPPAGYVSSTGAPTGEAGGYEPAPAPGDGTDDDDNGSAAGAAIRSALLALSPGGAPAGELDTTLPPGRSDRAADTGADYTLDIGLYRPAALGDLVWLDADGDGVQESGEGGVPDVRVRLYTAGGTFVAETSTDASGAYRFVQLAPGGYVVEFSQLPAGHFVTRRDSSAAGDAADSDADRFTGRTAVITLASGADDTSIDAGINQLVGLGDRVWEDRNGNGRQETGEPGVAGVTVTLFDAGTGMAIGTPQVTDLDGFYQFIGLPPGDYYLEFSALPGGYRFTAAGTGAADADSDAAPATGRTAIVTLTTGQHDPTRDAGIYRPAAVGDTVWLDADGDGVQESGEAGVNGVTVTLRQPGADGLPGTGDDTTVATAVTADTAGSAGHYRFEGLAPGDYYLVFSDLPAGLIFTRAGAAGSAQDSDAARDTGATALITLVSGADDPDRDAGLTAPVALGDRVWGDTDADGVQDSGEVGIAGVTVRLYEGGVLLATTSTDASGRYRFDGLPAGTYVVEIVPPAGYGVSRAAQGGDGAADSDIDRLTRRTAPVTLVAGEQRNDLDAGIYPLAALGSTVWSDTDFNGVYDPGEPGVPGVTVRLYRADGTLVGSVTTDQDGHYQFGSLDPGGYWIEFVVPGGYVVSPRDRGSDASDNDVDPATGRTALIMLGAGQHDPTWFLGMLRIDPSAVVLTAFAATSRDGGVLVRWETAQERDTWGFHLYRSADGRRATAVRVTPLLILARGSPTQGASYSWLDTGAQPGQRYTYWLQETELDGTTSEYGTTAIAAARTLVLLPLIAR